MRTRHSMRAALLGAVCLAPFCAGPVAAQTDRAALLSEAEIAALVAECRDLLNVADATVTEEAARREVAAIARANVEADCVAARGAYAAAGVQAAEPVEERARIQQEIVIEREAIVEGEVIVRQGPADVAVQNAPAEVAVTPGRSNVTVRQQPSEIVVRQAAPTISVEMPQPTIRIRMPAPEIFVRAGDPAVEVSSAEPLVEVRQGEPVVEVTVPNPEIDVNVAARLVDPSDPVDAEAIAEANRAAIARVEPSAEPPQVRVASNDPQITLGTAAVEPTVAVERAEPRVTFEAAEPVVEFTGRPTIEVERMGEPRVIFETAEQREERLRGEAGAEPGAQRLAAAQPEAGAGMAEPRRRPGLAGRITDEDFVGTDGSGMITVGELMSYDVVNRRGEDLGEVDRIVRNGERLFIVMAHGGFLGLGESEVAIPLADAEIRDERLILAGVTAEEIERLPEYDAASEQALDEGERVTLAR